MPRAATLEKKQTQISRQYRAAAVQPDTVDLEKRTVEVVWTTGAIGLRSPWWEEPYFEGLAVDEKSVRMDRINNGAPLLDCHRGWSNEAVIGVVERAWIKDGKGYAIVRFSKDQEADRIFQKVVERVLRNISVGYDVHEYTEQPQGKNEKYRTVIATDWEPVEISVVPIGFDDGAKVRSAEITRDAPQVTCVIHKLSKERQLMPPITEGQENQPAPSTPAPAAATTVADGERNKQIAAGERARIAEIRLNCRTLELGDEFADQLVNEGVEIERARELILAKAREKQKPVQPTSPTIHVRDNSSEMVRDMRDALFHRATGKGELSAEARSFRGRSLVGLARELLEKHNVRTRHMSDADVAMHALSFRSGSMAQADFPYLMADVANLIIRDSFDLGTTTHVPICQDREVDDFKEITSAAVSDIAKFLPVGEGGEFKRGILSDEGEKYKLGTYGRVFKVTRQVMMNNGFDIFAKLARNVGMEARELEADLVWLIFTSNPKMGDNKALFHADHANLTDSGGGGAAPDEAQLSKGRELMRKQKGAQGQRPRNIPPRYLIGPAALESKILQICNKEMLPSQSSNVNTFKTQLEPIIEARLDAVSSKIWYMTADGRVHDVVELAKLTGHAAPTTVLLPQTEDDAAGIKCYYDVAAKAIDYRTFYRNKGEN
jgi:hypothetical protein